MKLQLNDPNQLLDDDFIKWLLPKIRNKILADLKIIKLKAWDAYFNDSGLYKSIYKKKILSEDIIISGIMKLKYHADKHMFWIIIDPNIYVPGLDRVKVESACKLINFGNRDIVGYPIFTDTFEYFADNIQDYLEMYLNGIL